jgi:ornithine carbamoyltransferase
MRHLRTLWDISDAEQMQRVLLRAQALKRDRRDHRLAPTLSGRVIAMLFERESTRTRVSFEAGVSLLGGSAVVLRTQDTQLVKGEPLRDTARVFGSYCDALVVRTHPQDVIEEHARHAGVPVVNALSDLDHPCQVVTDLFTVFERREAPFDLVWAWVGDGGHMANGFVAAAALCGFELRVAVPPGRGPDAGYLERARAAGAKITVTHEPSEAVAGAHVVSTGAWSKPAEELGRFALNGGLLADADPDHFVLHRLPARRGEEITDDVIEGRHSVVFQQAANRLPVQQALLEWLLELPVL